MPGDSDHSLMEGMEEVYETVGRCCFGLEEAETDDLDEPLPAVENDNSDALVKIDVSEPLLFVEASDNRAEYIY
jgi:hypothetical protein